MDVREFSHEFVVFSGILSRFDLGFCKNSWEFMGNLVDTCKVSQETLGSMASCQIFPRNL